MKIPFPIWGGMRYNAVGRPHSGASPPECVLIPEPVSSRLGDLSTLLLYGRSGYAPSWIVLFCTDFLGRVAGMKNRGRPRKANTREEYLEVRLDVQEKQAFKEAADLAGLAVSAWVRERLRQAARKELTDSGREVAFLSQG
jgi:hypothetical protein